MSIGLPLYEIARMSERYISSIQIPGLTHEVQVAIKDAIASAVDANNKRLEQDIKRMLDNFERKLATR